MADADNLEQEIRALREVVRELTHRVYRIEQAIGVPSASPADVSALQPPAAVSPPVPGSPAVSESKPLPPMPARPVFASAEPDIDLESRIGSHWLNRIGISAVLIGVAYFLKYAFDNNWIGPAGRVTIGLLAGIAVVVWSERFRTRGYQ